MLEKGTICKVAKADADETRRKCSFLDVVQCGVADTLSGPPISQE